MTLYLLMFGDIPSGYAYTTYEEAVMEGSCSRASRYWVKEIKVKGIKIDA